MIIPCPVYCRPISVIPSRPPHPSPKLPNIGVVTCDFPFISPKTVSLSAPPFRTVAPRGSHEKNIHNPVHMTEPRILLASASATRRALLEAAGVRFAVQPARIDEESLRAALAAEEAAPGDIADALAEAKARRASARASAVQYVIGADQILDCEGEIFAKAETAAQAASVLSRLSGRTHRLHSAAVLYSEHRPIWRHVEVCRMQMRLLGPADIDAHLAAGLPSILESVGCYRYEDHPDLFTDVSGSREGILGLPLTPLLDILRRHGVLES